MLVLVKYKAKLSWFENNKYHQDILCDVTHTIDTSSNHTTIIDACTFQTTGFTFKPCQEISKDSY